VIWHVAKPPFYDAHKDLKYTPTNVAVAPNGDVYFADGYGSWFIHHLDKNGNYKRTFGGPGDGNTATLGQVVAAMAQRDSQDRTRATAPLVQATEAQTIDTTDLTVDEVVQTMLSEIRRAFS